MSSLKVIKQPIPEFYKDEGGKNNWMTAVFKLVGLKNIKSKVPLRAILYYESGQPVEARDQQILRLELEKKSGIMLDVKGSSNTTIDINFRIEKVSRRKDNQKFKLCLEVDLDHPLGQKLKKLGPAFTNPICVLSKRKIPAHLRSDPQALAALKSGKKRARSYSEARISGSSYNTDRMESRLTAKLEKMMTAIERLTDHVKTQEHTIVELVNVVNELKHEVSVLSPQQPGSSVDLSVLTSSERGGSGSILGQKRSISAVSDSLRPLTPNYPNNGNAAPNATGATQSPLSWVKATGGVGGRASASLSPRTGRNGLPAAVKRLKSEDMTFNFGAPGLNSPLVLERLDTPGAY